MSYDCACGIDARAAVAHISVDDADRAYHAWGANCGPGALAAIMGMTLDEVRPHMGDFERKGYTNPTLMNDALRSIGRPWRKIGAIWPNYGLVRVQWEGPWTEPGVPMRARYRYTHWIGAAIVNGKIGIFDINCINNGSGWVSLEDWKSMVVPHMTSLYPRSSGKWHITHAIEVPRHAAAGSHPGAARRPETGRQAMWETAMGMRGYAGSPAQAEDIRERRRREG